MHNLLESGLKMHYGVQAGSILPKLYTFREVLANFRVPGYHAGSAF